MVNVAKLNKRLTSFYNSISNDGNKYYVHEIDGLGFFLYAESDFSCSMQVEDGLRGRFGSYPVELGLYRKDAEYKVRKMLNLH